MDQMKTKIAVPENRNVGLIFELSNESDSIQPCVLFNAFETLEAANWGNPIPVKIQCLVPNITYMQILAQTKVQDMPVKRMTIYYKSNSEIVTRHTTKTEKRTTGGFLFKKAIVETTTATLEAIENITPCPPFIVVQSIGGNENGDKITIPYWVKSHEPMHMKGSIGEKSGIQIMIPAKSTLSVEIIQGLFEE